jgi:hypothetical protein
LFQAEKFHRPLVNIAVSRHYSAGILTKLRHNKR